VDAGDVPPTATPLDELPVDGVAEPLGERGEQVPLRMPLLAVGHEVHVGPRGGVLDGVDRIRDDGLPVVGVRLGLQVLRPGPLVDGLLAHVRK
jgi:hypothetical protein